MKSPAVILGFALVFVVLLSASSVRLMAAMLEVVLLLASGVLLERTLRRH